MAGKLFEAGNVDTGRDTARDRPAPEAMADKAGAVKLGKTGPALLPRQRTDRHRFDARRRKPPEPAKQRAVANCCSGEPGLERGDRAEFRAACGQPEFRAAGVLVVFAPPQRELDAIGVACQMFERAPGDLARPQCGGKADEQ